MKDEQKLWWNQAKSDFALFVQIRGLGVSECHLLHYLQMTAEKLRKAYLWRSGHAPPKTHVGFVRFLKALLDRKPAELLRLSRVLGFGRSEDLDKWVSNVQTLAYALQNIAPSEAGNGPNPEYPWPHEAPAQCPVDYTFPLWNQLQFTGQGRKLIDVIRRILRSFEQVC